jgi:hypothetical protein
LAPTTLVRQLVLTRCIRFIDLLASFRAEWRARRKPPPSPFDDWVRLGKRLEKGGHYDEK